MANKLNRIPFKFKNIFLIIITTLLFLAPFLCCSHFFNIPAAAQDFWLDEEIKAFAVTRFQGGFTEYEVRITWAAFGGADEYKIFKSSNQGEFEEVRNVDYNDEGFQLWWVDEDILEGNSYQYYIEGLWQEESVGRTDAIDIDFWLPSSSAQYPANNEVVAEENPEFKWESISINAFPFRNVIFSAQGEFILFDITEGEEVSRVQIENINIDSLRLLPEEIITEITEETASEDDEESEGISENSDNSNINNNNTIKEPNNENNENSEDDNEADENNNINENGEAIIQDTNNDTNNTDINNGDNEDFEENESESLFTKQHRYQWQYKVTGYDIENQPIAESITGGFFYFQESLEETAPEEGEEDEDFVEGGLNIEAEFLSYQIVDGEDVVIAQNKVNLRYKDITLKSNYLQIFIDRKELIASDQVTFARGNESFSSQAINYNWETEKIIMEGLSGEATGDKIKGVVYYQGDRYENFPETIDISGGVFTTCDLEEPHWHIEAEKITIYPDDKIIAKKVSWYEGKRKIFTLPSFMIFLRGKNQFPYWPDIGQSSSEGWFLKNQFNYVQDADSYGSIYLDLMLKKGIGAGVEHTFELGEEKIDDGELVLYFYGLKRKNTSIYDLDGKVSYWQNFENDLRLRANISYDGTYYGGSSTQENSHIIRPDFYFYKKWDEALLTITGKYNFNISNTTTSTGNIKLSYDQTITDKINSNLVLLYNSKDSTSNPAEYQLRPEWQLRYSGKGYSVRLITEKQFTFGGDPLNPSKPSTLDKLPELVFNKNNAKFLDTGINYSISASVGNYYESATDQQNIRGEYIINANRPFDITDKIRLTASGVYRQDVYLTGEARYMLGGKLDLRVGYQPEFYGNFSYSYYMSEGPTPFNFDTLSELSESASASVVLKPADNLQINLSTNYNFVTESFGSLGARLQWKPKGEHDVYLSTSYNLNNMEWSKRVDTRLSLNISEDWRMSYSGTVYFDDFDIRNSVISVVRDLHCREISINYRQSTKAIWLDFKINAFPTESITIGQ